jgi:PHP family Zn ribbon phosphoesterase
MEAAEFTIKIDAKSEEIKIKVAGDIGELAQAAVQMAERNAPVKFIILAAAYDITNGEKITAQAVQKLFNKVRQENQN